MKNELRKEALEGLKMLIKGYNKKTLFVVEDGERNVIEKRMTAEIIAPDLEAIKWYLEHEEELED